MTLHIVLDSGPLGLLSNPAGTAEVQAITKWSTACTVAGHRLYVPEVIDYELRRELLRAGKTKGRLALDALKTLFRYLPIKTDAMLRAAELWADARVRGIATGDPKKLDVDVILAAQALTLGAPKSKLIVAAPNVRHIAHFVAAADWKNITP